MRKTITNKEEADKYFQSTRSLEIEDEWDWGEIGACELYIREGYDILVYRRHHTSYDKFDAIELRYE